MFGVYHSHVQPYQYVGMCIDTHYKDTWRQLKLCCHITDLVCVHARNMLQKIQLQRVNRIGKVIVGMLTWSIALPVGFEESRWLASQIGSVNAPFY